MSVWTFNLETPASINKVKRIRTTSNSFECFFWKTASPVNASSNILISLYTFDLVIDF
ncbi:MAG: hypothetical protein WC356_06975 [Candidatus Micrarchaeia archaeon]